MSFEWQEEFIKYAYNEGVGFPGIFSKLDKVRLKINTVLNRKNVFRVYKNFAKIINLKKVQTPLIVLFCILPLLDLGTDYFGTYRNLSQAFSPVSRVIGVVMLMNLIFGPIFTGFLFRNCTVQSLIIFYEIFY